MMAYWAGLLDWTRLELDLGMMDMILDLIAKFIGVRSVDEVDLIGERSPDNDFDSSHNTHRRIFQI